MLGLMARARAMAALCRWPVDSWWGELLGLLGYPDPLEQFHRGVLGLLRLDLPDPDGGQGDVVQDRHVGEEVEGLGDHPDVPADRFDVSGVLVEQHPVHDDVPPLVLLQLVDGAEEGGLAGAGGSDYNHHLAPPDGGGDAPDGVVAVVPFVDVPADDDVPGGVQLLCWLGHGGCLPSWVQVLCRAGPASAGIRTVNWAYSPGRGLRPDGPAVLPDDVVGQAEPPARSPGRWAWW